MDKHTHTQDGAVDGDRFYQYLREDVGPTLTPHDARNLPKSVVFLDNVRAPACAPAPRSGARAQLFSQAPQLLSQVNYQHEPRVLNFFARKGVKVVHCARYDPRGSPIEAAFAQVRATLTQAASSHTISAPLHAAVTLS